MLVSRRGFLSFLAAPAIVHAGNLMPIKPIPIDPLHWYVYKDTLLTLNWRIYNMGVPYARAITAEWEAQT
jgi:hypothetical protein